MIETSLSQSEPMALPERPRGGSLRSVIAHSLLAAMMIITQMVVFLPAVLFHCAVRNGRRAAAGTLLLAAMAGVVFASAAAAKDLEGGKFLVSVLTAIVLGLGVPSLMVLKMVERGDGMGRVLAVLVLCSAAGLVATELLARTVIDYSPLAAHARQLREQVDKLWPEPGNATGFPAPGAGMGGRFRGYFISLMPAWALTMFAVFFALSLLMFGRLKVWRDLAARRGDAEAPGAYLFRNFALPDWVLFAFIIGGLAPLVSGLLQTIAANVLAVVAFLYMLQGIAILRFMVGTMVKGPGALLLGGMLFMVFTISPVGPVVLSVAGLFDPFFDFRHFKKRKDDSNESHSD